MGQGGPSYFRAWASLQRTGHPTAPAGFLQPPLGSRHQLLLEMGPGSSLACQLPVPMRSVVWCSHASSPLLTTIVLPGASTALGAAGELMGSSARSRQQAGTLGAETDPRCLQCRGEGPSLAAQRCLRLLV